LAVIHIGIHVICSFDFFFISLKVIALVYLIIIWSFLSLFFFAAVLILWQVISDTSIDEVFANQYYFFYALI
jgi:hypothetical protein